MDPIDTKRQAARAYLRDRGIVNLYQRSDGTWAPPKSPVAGSRVLTQWIAGRQRSRLIGARAFDAARRDRLTASWLTGSASLDADVRMALGALRARSRDLAQNNAYGRRFLQMVQTHIVGPNGFTLQMAVPSSVAPGEIDRAASAVIEAEWARWCKPRYCDITGRRSFPNLCAVAVKAAARDGEALVRLVRRADLPYGVALQLIDADRLDEKANGEHRGNRVVMGVEINADGKPVAYHLHTRHPGDYLVGGAETDRIERVPAGDVIHLFTAEAAEQHRGVPWMHAAMKRLRDLGNFEDSAVIAAHVGAAKMGFFTVPEPEPTALASAQDSTTGQLIDEVEPGVFPTLPPGYDFKPFNPDYPHANFDPFVKACLRGVAAGIGASYHVLSGDLTDVNFSSIRAGTLEEREGWMMLQSWFADAFLDPVFEAWLDGALLKGALQFLSASSRDRYLRGASWQGRRWQWVDPVKDIEAATRAIRLGVKTRRQVCAEQGLDFEDVVRQLAAEKALMVDLGLDADADDAAIVEQVTEAAAA
jgi:lambda family phage portal protein